MDSRIKINNGHDENIGSQAITPQSEDEPLVDPQIRFTESLLDNTTTPLFVIDRHHRIIVWNRACTELTGKSSEEMIGTKDQWRPFYPEVRPVLADLVLDGLNGSLDTYYSVFETLPDKLGSLRAEGRYTNMNEKDRYLVFDAAPVLDEQGNVVAAVETLHDITDRKVAERKLQKQQAELEIKHEQLSHLFKQVENSKREWEQTMDCIGDMVLIIGPDGKVRRCNRAVCTFTGRNYQEISTMTWKELIFTPEMDIGKLNGDAGEIFHRPSGRGFYLNTYVTENSGAGTTVITLHDLTEIKKVSNELSKAYDELKSTHMQLLQQEKMASIGQLAAGVAHEINNPMGFISSNLATLAKYTERLKSFIEVQKEVLQKCAEPDDIKLIDEARRKFKVDYVLDDIPKLVTESTDGAERVRAIVQNLKSFSRIDEAETVAVNMNECLESTINIAWNELKYKTTLKREFGELPLVACHPQQLNQVFLNLLVNAAHAIETQGEVIVRTWQEGAEICIAISDTGSGIPEEIRNKIFEPFFTTKEVGKGTGLGLSISYDIVKKHKGTIEVASEVGKGTTFTVRLPVAGEKAT